MLPHIEERRIGVREMLTGGPYELRCIGFCGRENSDYEAGEYRREQNIAPGILRLLGKGRNAVESDIRKYRDRSSAEHGLEIPHRRIIERAREKPRVIVWFYDDVPSCGHKENRNDHSHGCGQSGVNPG